MSLVPFQRQALRFLSAATLETSGVAMPGDFLTYDMADFQKVISINLFGVLAETIAGSVLGGSQDDDMFKAFQLGQVSGQKIMPSF